MAKPTTQSRGREVGAPEWRDHFPALAQRVNDHPLVYLDTAATAQRPTAVLDAVANFYCRDNANPGPTLHSLARLAHDRYDAARRAVAEFIGAVDSREIVFTRGTTEAINLVAAAWGGANLGPGDEVLLSIAEHASNLVPWQLAARQTGAVLRFFDIDDDGQLRLDDLEAKLSPRTKLVAFSHISNVLGLINPAAEVGRLARRVGAAVLVDAAQSVPHLPVNVQALDCDFLAFSGHKMLGPMGIGVLWARRALLDRMPPYQGGSNMAHDVDVDGLELAEGALKFGAGTPNVAGAVGLAAAVRFLQRLGPNALWTHEQAIARHALDRLGAVPGLRLLGGGSPGGRIALFSFTLEGYTPAEVLRALDALGIAVRAGDLASLPLLKRLGTPAAVRASCYLYTTHREVDLLADALERLARRKGPQRSP